MYTLVRAEDCTRVILKMFILVAVVVVVVVSGGVDKAGGFPAGEEDQGSMDQSVYPIQTGKEQKDSDNNMNATDEGENQHTFLTPRFMGIDVGDESTNFQAGMWLLGLVVMLASAIPAVFLDTTLGYRSFTSKYLHEGDINRDINTHLSRVN